MSIFNLEKVEQIINKVYGVSHCNAEIKSNWEMETGERSDSLDIVSPAGKHIDLF